MTAQLKEAPAGIGHNRPSPFEEVRDRVELYYGEAQLWLDGKPIDSQEQADELSNLLNLIRDARKAADEARKEEKRPFDEGAKAVQAKYKPLLEKADTAASVVKQALQPWLDEQDRIAREAAEAARREAEERQRAAEEAMRKAREEAADLAARENAERLAAEAKKATQAASKASKTTAKASGGIGRAAALRTTYEAVITDERAFAAYAWQRHHDELMEWMQQLAARLVRSNQRGIPGVEVIERKEVV